METKFLYEVGSCRTKNISALGDASYNAINDWGVLWEV